MCRWFEFFSKLDSRTFKQDRKITIERLEFQLRCKVAINNCVAHVRSAQGHSIRAMRPSRGPPQQTNQANTWQAHGNACEACEVHPQIHALWVDLEFTGRRQRDTLVRVGEPLGPNMKSFIAPRLSGNMVPRPDQKNAEPNHVDECSFFEKLFGATFTRNCSKQTI